MKQLQRDLLLVLIAALSLASLVTLVRQELVSNPAADMKRRDDAARAEAEAYYHRKMAELDATTQPATTREAGQRP